MAHRLAWLYIYEEFPEKYIDHINRIRDDNRIENLREANDEQNCMNKGFMSNNTSGFKGVCWAKHTKRWLASCGYKGKNVHLGYYNTPEYASIAYQKFAKLVFGEFYDDNPDLHTLATAIVKD